METPVALGESLLSPLRLALLSAQHASGCPRLRAVFAKLLDRLAVGSAAFFHVPALLLQARPPALVELAMALLTLRLRSGRLVAAGLVGSIVLRGQPDRQQ